jgi:hypothetical protein
MNFEEINDDMELYFSYEDEEIFDKMSQIHPMKNDFL